MNGDAAAGFISPALLDRYLAGECTPDEVRQVHAWLDHDDANHAVLAQLREVRQAAPSRGPWDTERMWRRLAQDLDADQVHTPPPSIARPVGPRYQAPSRVRGMAWGMSALVAAVVLVMITTFATRHVAGVSATPQTEYVTARMQRATVHLADGTTVVLAPDTRLSVAGDFGAATRTVSVTGEAEFTVARTTAVPFVVHTRNVTAQVLGTTFAVRGYPEESAVHVAVQEGRVAVNTVVTNQGDVATVGGDGTAMVEHADSLAKELLSWTNGVLAFHKAPLREVAAELSRWYGVDFVINDPSIAQRHLTAVFQHDSLGDVMYLLAHTLQVRVQRAGRTVFITSGSPGESRAAVAPVELAVRRLGPNEVQTR